MNVIIQYALAFLALTIAVIYLFKTFIWWPKKNTSKTCNNKDCGCR
jgi:hypothetical protein